MRFLKYMIALLMLIFIIGTPFIASATDTGLLTESLSNEEISDILTRRAFTMISSYTPLTTKSFDVRDDHMIVIGSSEGDNAVIAVYNDCGIFQYGFKTEQYGSFTVMWIGNDIAYYSVRSQLVFRINEEGKITDIRRVANTTENSIYYKNVLSSRTRKVGNTTYSMTNGSVFSDVFSTSFKKIIKTDTEGTTVIYDASGNYWIRLISVLVIFLLLSAIFVGGLIAGVKKYRRTQ